MKTQDAVRYFGSPAQLAKALGITAQAVTQWGEEIPKRRQYEIERLTGGRLKADRPDDLPEEARAAPQGEKMQDTAAVHDRIAQLSALVAQLALLIDDIERISNAHAAASLRVQYHQAMADLLECTHRLEQPADRRTDRLRQRHIGRAVEYQRALDQMGGG